MWAGMCGCQPGRRARCNHSPGREPQGLKCHPASCSPATGRSVRRGLVACTYPLSTQDVPAADYRKIRAQFAGSRWPDLRNAGTAYVDLAMQLPDARYTTGYQTVWFYQRRSAACAKHGQ